MKYNRLWKWKYMKNYEKLNGIFLCKLIYDGFFNKINS